MKTYALLADAWGGHGGIAVFNRDLVTALLDENPEASVTAAPRVISHSIGDLPDRLSYRVGAASGTAAFVRTLLTDMPAIVRSDMIYCAHVNLAPIAWVLGRLSRRPVLCALYGYEAWSSPSRKIADWAVRRMDRYYAISSFTRDRFVAWSGVPLDRIELLPNAIHLDHYAPGPKDKGLATKLGLEGASPVLMTFGRLVSRERAKGFDEVLDILPRLLKRFPQLIYVIAGDGDDRERLEARVVDEELVSHVVFTGLVDEQDKADLYRLADLYVMPSRGEGFGFVFLEALASGIPVIASTIDGSRDAVRNGELGRMVDPDDPDALFASISDALAENRRGDVPEGLSHFSFHRFVERVHALAGRTLAG
ncbi:glycosyltransferase family 1 protein [Sulfitobacter sp. JL08]|uniref:glycosyltransferase family 4 protein n=1 Tax=Sulfitobacter sp. JL08 TaxID=2070369 RepID=UPI000E0A1F4B|nr:glycosyltransferase family 4 protein [Sulfitobacter sp. JL08]AXI54119.1 glycosyltransferase family 1 protein [Sulfitobacter sp. JL08]